MQWNDSEVSESVLITEIISLIDIGILSNSWDEFKDITASNCL